MRKGKERNTGKKRLLSAACLVIGVMALMFAGVAGQQASSYVTVNVAQELEEKYGSDMESAYALMSERTESEEPSTVLGSAASVLKGWLDIQPAWADDADADAEGDGWNYSVYYVGQSDRYYVEKTDDFSLKYQMEFHTDEDLDAEAIEIKVPAVLLTYRDGTFVTPSDIGVPYGVPGDYTYSKNSALNYYYADADGNAVTLADYAGSADDLYVVFWNYRDVTAGTNMAWQVLYKGLDAMETVDMTEWELPSWISVEVTRTEEAATGNTQEPVTYKEVQTGEGSTLTGLVDTQAKLASVAKTGYDVTTKSYTPCLYTEKQVSSYISSWTDEGTAIYADSFDDYVYVVWQVSVSGSGSQPFSLAFLDETDGNGTGGTIMGYRTGTGRYVSLSFGSTDSEGYVVSATGVESESWDGTFYVVTAYPASEVTDGTEVENTVTVKLTPYDGVDAVQYKSASATVTYEDYEWEYTEGDHYTGSKTSSTTYAAWLELWKDAYENGEDFGTFSFSTSAYSRAYSVTHILSGDGAGDYTDGAYWTVEVEDSSMYLNGTELSYEDYYLASVSVSRTDLGYDIYEDMTVTECETAGIDRTVHVYAMYADNADVWEEAGTLPYDENGGTVTYTFTAAQLSREPYAVKAVYDTTDYSSTCSINVGVVLRASAPVAADIYAADPESLVLTDTSDISAYYNDGTDDVALYSAKVSAAKTFTGLNGANGAEKKVTASNDAANARVKLKYTMTAWDGYVVYDSATAASLAALGIESPSRNTVAFYDLLPYGVKYDASVTPVAKAAGSTTQTEVADVEITENWNGTGRTMVVFCVEYSGADMAQSAWEDGTGTVWEEKWEVTFSAYYDWKDIDTAAADGNDNIFAFMPWTDEAYGTEGYADAMRALLGSAYADDGRTPGDDYAGLQYADINGDGETAITNVLYASCGTGTDVAISAEDTITKLVRADANVSAAYETSASVEEGAGYTYDVTVTTVKGLSNLVIFDRLEYGYEDHSADEDGIFDESGHWTGTLASVDVQGLVLAGADPVVYYNASRDAAVAEDGSTDIDELLTETNGWYTYDAFIAEYGDIGLAKAIAIDVRKASGGSDFVLPEAGSVTFQARMTAPDGLDATNTVLGTASDYADVTYAYNNTSFYSTSTASGTTAVVDGSTVRVSIGSSWEFSVEKEISGSVPDGYEDTEFEFRLYTDGDASFSQRIYTLYNYDSETGTWVADSGTYATDYNGYLYLKAGQRAVFTDVTAWEAAHLAVAETESAYWDASYETVYGTDDDPDENVCSWTVKNTYMPPLYVTKAANGAKTGADLSGYAFTFVIYIQENGEWVPYADADYWIVEAAKTNGTEPVKLSEGTTGDGGEITLSIGQTAAIFLPSAGTKYKVVETEHGGDFLCTTDTYTGTVATRGTAVTVTNTYRWKELVITKTLTHQDASECTEVFTFQLVHVEDDGTETPVEDVAWTTADGEGEAIVSGTTDGNGEFTALAAGYTITVEHLDAGETYILRETETGTYYSSTTGDKTVTMPVYSSGTSVTYENDWLKRDLSVTKYVAGDEDGSADDVEFTYTLTVNGRPAFLAQYTVTSGGSTVGTYWTSLTGQFTLKANQTATFEDIGMLGDSFEVVETQDASYPQIYPVDGNMEAASWTGTLSGDGNSVTFVNGTEGSLLVSKTYTYDADDTDAAAYVSAMQDTTTDEGKALRTDAAVTLTMTADGARWPSSDVTVTLIDTLTGDSSDGTWTKAGITVEPWVAVVIPAAALDGVESFTVTEDSDSQHRVLEWQDGSWVEVSQSYPADDAAFSGTLSSSPVVQLVNNVESISMDGSVIYKRMAVGADEPDAGGVLVWVLEQYDGSQWVPAEGVRYLAFDESGVTCDRVLETGSDGVITLTKTDNGMPYVTFLDIEVSLNLYSGMEEGDYRLTEDTDASDGSWGILAGYGTDASGYTYSLDGEDAVSFVNSNRTAGLTVEKETGEESATQFTFYLAHVISEDADGNITAAEAGAGISYMVYDSGTGDAVSHGVTGADGSFSLMGGQYAVFSLADGTVWTVSEGSTSGWSLADLYGETDDSILGWLLKMLSPNTAEARMLDTMVYVIEAETSYTTVEAGTALDPDRFTVTAYNSSGSDGTVLASGDFTLSPASAQDTSGEMEVEISYAGATDTVSLTVAAPTYNVKYAVAIYGIRQDTYSTDGGATTETAGLTFGPATGASYISSYRAHVSEGGTDDDGNTVVTSSNFVTRTADEAETDDVAYCIHWLTWSQIIEQSAKDPTVFQDCLEYGCTHSVYLNLNGTIMGTDYEGTMDNGDGAGVLYNSINSEYRRWDGLSGGGNYSTAGYWPASKIRANLNGADSYTDTSTTAVAGSYVLDSDTCLLSCFPSVLQDAIVQKEVVSGYSYSTNSSYRYTTYDSLWLFSVKEIFGYTTTSRNLYYEGSQYRRMSYYSNMGKSSVNALKVGYYETGSALGWWLRSVSSSTYAYYVSYSTSSSYVSYIAYGAYGLAPGFCLP